MLVSFSWVLIRYSLFFFPVSVKICLFIYVFRYFKTSTTFVLCAWRLRWQSWGVYSLEGKIVRWARIREVQRGRCAQLLRETSFSYFGQTGARRRGCVLPPTLRLPVALGWECEDMQEGVKRWGNLRRNSLLFEGKVAPWTSSLYSKPVQKLFGKQQLSGRIPGSAKRGAIVLLRKIKETRGTSDP